MLTNTSRAEGHRQCLRALPLGILLMLLTYSSVEAREGDGFASLRGALHRGQPVALGSAIARSSQPEDLLTLARIAFRASSSDALNALRVKLEALEEEGHASSAADVAVGFTSLGLAKVQMADETQQGSDLSLLLADAVTRAKRVIEKESDPRHALHQLAVLLLAEVRLAEGSLSGLDVVESHAKAFKENESQRIPELDAYEARVLYARAVGRPLVKRALSPVAAKEYSRAASLARRTLDAMSSPNVLSTPTMREALGLREAWSHHRLYAFEAAERAYRAVWATGEKPTDRARTFAIRGLTRLYGNRPKQLDAALSKLVTAEGTVASDAARALVKARIARGALGGALRAAQSFASEQPGPEATLLTGNVFQAMKQWHEARAHYERAYKQDPSSKDALHALELLARAMVPSAPERAVEIYESLLARRPNDIYLRNNLGFILRDLVTPHTRMAKGNRQVLRSDAPKKAHDHLKRCVEVYSEAVDLIDPALDGERELEVDWDYAGIINDLALILHYFVDVEAPLEAEALYHRALRMTEFGFKDTYSPNLQRLYRFVLKDRTYVWWKTAKVAKESILMEQRDARGTLELVPDERKRAAATRDEAALRKILLDELTGANDGDDR